MPPKKRICLISGQGTLNFNFKLKNATKGNNLFSSVLLLTEIFLKGPSLHNTL